MTSPSDGQIRNLNVLPKQDVEINFGVEENVPVPLGNNEINYLNETFSEGSNYKIVQEASPDNKDPIDLNDTFNGGSYFRTVQEVPSSNKDTSDLDGTLFTELNYKILQQAPSSNKNNFDNTFSIKSNYEIGQRTLLPHEQHRDSIHSSIGESSTKSVSQQPKNLRNHESDTHYSQTILTKNQLHDKPNINRIKYFEKQIHISDENIFSLGKNHNSQSSNTIDIQSKHTIDLESMLDQSEDTDLILARRDSHKDRSTEIVHTISHYYKIKCQGYEKAITDYSQLKYFSLFITYIDFDTEIIYRLATCDIQDLDQFLKNFIVKRWTNHQIIQELSKYQHPQYFNS